MLDTDYRHYHARHLRRTLRVIYAYVILGGGVILLIDVRDRGVPPTALAVVYGAFLLAGIAWGERVSIKTGLEECPEGFIDRHNFGSRRLRLEEVARFESAKTLGVGRVYAVRRSDGKRVPVPGLTQGRLMVWDGGETHDIVSILNDRLQARLVAETKLDAERPTGIGTTRE